jgi:PTS system mannose-specific IIA component
LILKGTAMIGILLITHGTFGESLIQNVCHVLNKRPPSIGQLGIAAQDDPLEILPVAQRLLKEVDDGEGVLILTDILGATPSNSHSSCLTRDASKASPASACRCSCAH